jgi:hypothetical protein
MRCVRGLLIQQIITFDMKKPLYFLILFIALPAAVSAQKVEWNVDSYGFFDNSEGEDNYRKDETMAGVRISPEMGLSWENGRHSIYAGYSGIAEFGADNSFSYHKGKLYYQYNNKRLKFLFGAFSREQLLGEYPSYLICDSIYYYRPVMQGWAFQYTGEHGYFEAFTDWTRKQSADDREQFMSGLSTAFNFHHLRIGAEGYYYHYALSAGKDSTQHIHDFMIGHYYAGLIYKRIWFLDSLAVNAGVLASEDRDRGNLKKWYSRAGFIGEVYARWNRLMIDQTVYYGERQQPFLNKGWNRYYWGDTYTRSNIWSRTDVFYQIIRNHFVDAYAGVVFNVTDQGVNAHQVLNVRLNLGSIPRPRKWRK